MEKTNCSIPEATDAPIPGDLYPELVDVAGNCPPEDVGGLPGYELFIEALVDKRHPEHRHLTAWHGGPFDPNAPETDELKERLINRFGCAKMVA